MSELPSHSGLFKCIECIRCIKVKTIQQRLHGLAGAPNLGTHVLGYEYVTDIMAVYNLPGPIVYRVKTVYWQQLLKCP